MHGQLVYKKETEVVVPNVLVWLVILMYLCKIIYQYKSLVYVSLLIQSHKFRTTLCYSQ